MPSEVQYSDVLRRLQAMENRISTLEEMVQNQAIVDAHITANIESMKREFDGLRTDVLATVKEHTSNTWKLIHKGVYILGFLVFIIIALVGVKVAPELLKLLI